MLKRDYNLVMIYKKKKEMGGLAVDLFLTVSVSNIEIDSPLIHSEQCVHYRGIKYSLTERLVK